MENFSFEKHEVPKKYLAKWQKTVDVMARVFEVPAGLIMRVRPTQIEVLVSSHTADNPYKPNEKADLGGGLYCETVMETRSQLQVPNALHDEHWKDNLDVELNMIFYLGIPLIWPDNQIFGTICVLDGKTRHFSKLYQELLWEFKEIIEADFRVIEHEKKMKKRTIEIEKSRKAAEAANRAKSEFLANMSHELRTPLNAILGFSQLMERDPAVTKSLRENLNIIKRSGAHLLDLINDVLDMSTIEAGQTPLNKKIFDLYRTLDVIEEMIRSKAGAKELQFIVSREADVPRYIRTDEQKLRQVLLNLLGNAVKFTSNGQIVLRIQSSNLKPESKIDPFQYPSSVIEQQTIGIQFQILDTGMGIARDEIEKIFDPFVQKQSSKMSSEGTGLGLAISRKFVQTMGGDIIAKSRVGKGSTFKFDIRIELSNKTRIKTEKPVRHVIGLAPGQPDYRILVAEDHPENRALLSQLLQSAGFEVHEAVNGEEAIELYKQQQPSLIWMDIRMPVMEGLAATKKIRKMERSLVKGKDHIPILALTAHAFEDEKESILAAGCDDLVRKPFQEAEIFSTMKKYLGVRYVYEDPIENGAKGSKQPFENILSPKALADLPDGLLTELKQAIIDLDVDLIQSVIEHIRELNAIVADGLADLVNNFQYEKILAFLQKDDG